MDAVELPGAGQDADLGLGEQVLGLAGQRAEAVDQLLAEVGEMVEADRSRPRRR